jgi:hypothetical protein
MPLHVVAGCENRKFLSGGSAWMVYSEFVISTRDAFGEYQACNPCSGQVGDGMSFW